MTSNKMSACTMVAQAASKYKPGLDRVLPDSYGQLSNQRSTMYLCRCAGAKKSKIIDGPPLVVGGRQCGN